MVDLRQLPSVDRILNTPRASRWLSNYGRRLTLDAIRMVLDEYRSGLPLPAPSDLQQAVLDQVESRLSSWTTPSLRKVINATGVILHTNLGRSPLCRNADAALQSISSSYSNLEYDLESGRRGERTSHIEAQLVRLTGAEAGLVVNNNAAAVLLTLTALANRRRVVIARSQLVEIGGGFRVPDVMKQSGAKLVEVGTTNRVHLRDYQDAISSQPIRLVMRAHRSNFQILGFTSEPSLAEIAGVAHQAGVPLLDDLGSGAVLDTADFGLAHEPMVQESLAAGADLVCFSGDKLLGGPQAGIIVGKADLVSKLKKHPLTRAIRADKLCLAALSATLAHYLVGDAVAKIPVWVMIATKPEDIRTRVLEWIDWLGAGEIIPGLSTVGGGSLPGETLPTYMLALETDHPDRLLSQLRQADPPIIARVERDRVVLDPRTVLPDQEPALRAALKQLLQTTRVNIPQELS
jgi:L-seryl-tRNA(Ser) seleniumtransferase